MARPPRRVIRRIHGTVGLVLGLLFAAWGVSGSALVFDETLEAWLDPRLAKAGAPSGPEPIRRAVDAAEAAFPERAAILVRLPRQNGDAYRVWLDDAARTRVYVDPATGERLGTNAVYGGPVGLLRDLHVHLFAGETGLALVGIVGMFLLSMLATGVCLWWPGRGQWRGALAVKWRAARARIVYDLHRVVGAVAAIVLFVSALTGVCLAFYDTAGAVLRGALGGEPVPTPPRIEAGAGAPKPPSAFVDRARRVLPEAVPTWVMLPRAKRRPLVVRMRHPGNPHPEGHSFVAFHPVTGERVGQHDWRTGRPGQKAIELAYPLHIGRALGPVYRWAMFVAGFGPALLLATGAWMAWHRRGGRRRARATRPEPRAAPAVDPNPEKR